MSAPTMGAASTTPPQTPSNSPMPDLYARRLSDRLQYQQRQIQTMTRAQRVAQLGYSSLENEWMNVYDAEAQLKMRMGLQDDGTFAVTYKEGGNPAPAPTAPLVSPGEGSIKVGVDGTFINNTEPPKNLERFDIHISRTQNFTPTQGTAHASLPPYGGVATIAASNTDWYVKVVAVDNADVKGTASTEVAVLPLPFTTLAAYSVGAEQLKSTIVMTSRLIIGDPVGRRYEMDPIGGLQAFNNSGQRTFWQDADTGNVTVYGRFMTQPQGSGVNLVIGEPDESGRASTIKFAVGTPVNGRYLNVTQMVTTEEDSVYPHWNGSGYYKIPVFRMFGPDFRRYMYNKYETTYTKAYMNLSQEVRFGMNRYTQPNQDSQDLSYDFMGYAQGAGYIRVGMSIRQNNDDWQPTMYMPSGDYASYGAGNIGWFTRGSGTSWYCGLKFYCPPGSRNSTDKIVGPDLNVTICSQPAVYIRDHRDISYVPLYASTAGPPSSMSVKNSIDRAPMSDEGMLEALRKVVPAYYHYDNEPQEIKNRIGKHYGFIAEDFEDAGIGWLLQTTGRDDNEQEKALDYFGVVAFLAACVRTLDEELDEVRRSAKVRLPRRERRVRGKRG